MYRRYRFVVWSVLLVLPWLGWPALVPAAQVSMGPQSIPGMGPLAVPSGQVFGAGSSQAKDVEPAISVQDSFVSFIDAAALRNVVGLRFDAGYDNRQPTRAEYFHPKGGLPNSRGFPFIETRIDYQDLTSYAEYSMTPWFSMFMEAPYRWLNPEVNENQHGGSDMRYGMKLCTWNSDGMIATILVRLYQPTAQRDTLGTSHWSIEPGLLAAYRINDKFLLEGELRYWMPLGGSDFAGDVLRYGLGISYGQRKASGLWYMPVLEGIGWTVMNGQTISATSPDSYIIQDAHGQTIANGYLGLRVGYGRSLEFYVGYGRSFTGDFWQRDLYRIEFRFIY